MSEESRAIHAATSTARALKKEAAGKGGEAPTSGTVDRLFVDSIIENWEATPKKVAGKIIEKYGLPNEATASRLIWYNTGPWKRTIVYRDEVPHNFPKPHTDVLEQYLDYRVPPEETAKVSRFDGSIVIERTKGEVSARCDMEEMNFLAFNLMHDVVTGRKSPDEARQEYADTAVAFVMRREAPYTEELKFNPTGGTADKDEIMIAESMLHQIAEKAKDLVDAAKG